MKKSTKKGAAEMTRDEISAAMRAIGSMGGKATAKKLTKKQRIERAKTAVAARIKKQKGGE